MIWITIQIALDTYPDLPSFYLDNYPDLLDNYPDLRSFSLDTLIQLFLDNYQSFLDFYPVLEINPEIAGLKYPEKNLDNLDSYRVNLETYPEKNFVNLDKYPEIDG